MNKTFTKIAGALVALIAGMTPTQSKEATLHVGDAAPALKASKWVKGDPIEMYVMFNELEKAGAPYDGLAVALMIAAVVNKLGTDEQKERIIPSIISGEALVCMGYSEADFGSDVASIKTRAVKDGDEWVINGHKLWPTNTAGVGQLFGVPCTTRLGSTDPNDFALIFVPADVKGVTQGGPYEKAGMAADKNGDLWFEDVRVPAWYRAHG
ncbi:MAG: acyl-CoA dehydrogenase, partial [Verrucomicrobiota bacterium]